MEQVRFLFGVQAGVRGVTHSSSSKMQIVVQFYQTAPQIRGDAAVAATVHARCRLPLDM